MENAGEVLEAVEQNKEATDSPFDRRVAVTMAIQAALLATVTMLGHQANDAALEAQIGAGIKQTESSNQWSYYQAKNIRNHLNKTNLQLLPLFARTPGSESTAAGIQANLAGQTAKNEKDMEQIKLTAEALARESNALQQHSRRSKECGDHFDMAEFCLQLGLVLSSLAVLTKRRAFWFAGIVVGIAGIGIGAWSTLALF